MHFQTAPPRASSATRPARFWSCTRRNRSLFFNPPLRGAIMKIKPATKRGKVIIELTPKDQVVLGRVAKANNPKPAPFKLKRILVPIDFSACSKKALQYAVPLARQFGASLALLHIVPMSYPVGAEFATL